MPRPLCTLIGFGPGLGTAYAETFRDAGYDLALLSRSGGEIEATEGIAKGFACDASNPDSVQSTLLAVAEEMGRPVDVLIYNADLKTFGPYEEVSIEAFEQSWRVSVLGLYAAVRQLGPEMTARGEGAIIVSGATAALRGAVWTTALAPSKSSQRILAQSLAKQLGPKGVHVGYIVIDGVIDTEETRTHFAPDKPDEYFMQPGKIAEAALMLVQQDRSAWTFEMDLRPFGETW